MNIYDAFIVLVLLYVFIPICKHNFKICLQSVILLCQPFFLKKSSMYVVYTLRVFSALTYVKKIYKKIPRAH